MGTCRWFKLDPQNIRRRVLADGVVDHALPGWKLVLDLKLVSPSFSVREVVNHYIDAGIAAVSTYTNVATPEATLAHATRSCGSGTSTH